MPGAATPTRDSEHRVLVGDGELCVARSFSAGGPKRFEMVLRRSASR